MRFCFLLSEHCTQTVTLGDRMTALIVLLAMTLGLLLPMRLYRYFAEHKKKIQA